MTPAQYREYQRQADVIEENQRRIEENIEYYSIIKELKLTKLQVLEIVNEWYTRGMCPDIFQNEYGEDLEEYINIEDRR